MLFAYIFRVFDYISFSQAVEISQYFRGEVLGFCLVLDDGDFEMAAVNFSGGAFGWRKADFGGNHIDLDTLLAEELDLKLPAVELDVLICVKMGVQFLSEYRVL